MSNLLTPQATLNLIDLLSQLSRTLESRKFIQFWNDLNSSDYEPLSVIVKSINNFEGLVRRSIGLSVSSCFKSIDSDRLSKYLNFSASEHDQLIDWVKQFGWSFSSDNRKVIIPNNSDNCPVTVVIRENTTIDDLQHFIAKSIVC
ncbi:hypothetical protein H4Q26_014056 [Puccinia striiformis f. sp. tritici PST-130]|nr:hypothetical protein H4Q26_014056 [Puccinia striiformis f. sp. tritici PST-130]